MRNKKLLGALLLVASLTLVASACAEPLALPTVSVGMGKVSKPADVAVVLQIFFLMTVISLAPSLLMMTTSFTRIVVVLSFLRSALGTQQAPSNQIVVGLSLFLTFFIMAPVWQQINTQALQPYKAQTITQEEALKRGVAPVRKFMLSQVREKDIALFEDLSRGSFEVADRSKVDLRILIPAFMTSELRRGFEIGFLIVLPFLVIDMIVAALTMSMGMMMLPPSVISLPVKILFFVLVDGWNLLVGSLVRSVS